MGGKLIIMINSFSNTPFSSSTLTEYMDHSDLTFTVKNFLKYQTVSSPLDQTYIIVAHSYTVLGVF